MGNALAEVLMKIAEEYRDEISVGSGTFLELDIGEEAAKLGYSNIAEAYRGIAAAVPLKRPLNGMKVMMDGRTFVDYAQLETGIIIPRYVAEEAALPNKHYEAPESIVRVFG
jgi:hypothetical protein